jgi:hypothetical protein
MLGLALLTAAIAPCLCPPIATLHTESHRCCEPGGPALHPASEDCCNAPVAMQTAPATLDSALGHQAADRVVVVTVAVKTPRTVVPSATPPLIALRI